jgi:phosphoglycolate phosphatase
MSLSRPSPLPPPQAILFDLDGTLIDSVQDLALSANHVRAHYGLAPLSTDRVRSYIGDGARKLVQRTLGDDDPRVDEALRLFRAHYAEHLLDHTQPYPGVVEALVALAAWAGWPGRAGRPGRARPAGLRMAVVSNKPQEMCDAILRGLGMARHFAVVVGARPQVPVKPAPDLVVLALREMGVEPRQAWVVGDSPNDIGAGNAAGCVTIGLTSGLCSPEAVAAAGPDVLLQELGELPRLLQG